jgi:2-polyprenyl-3-methyl-5-hydroxy-6-metoxy-1,4-benzoquinol methylase
VDPLEQKTSADIYVFEIDEDGDTAAANVLRLVGNNKKVLEIGAGPGSISKPLVMRNNCSVTALELDPNCIPILEGFCERVVSGDLNGTDWVDQFEPQSFDVVVIADVLEHLVNPWRTLRSVATLLRDQGYVVCSIPNASHSVVLASFATDDVDYRNWGLLDRTHIRFFGVKNVQALFSQAGLRIVDARYVVIPPEVTEFAELWNTLPANTKAVLDSGPFSQVYQTVVRAELDRSSKTAEFILERHPPVKKMAHAYHRAAPPAFRRWASAAARRLLTKEQRQKLKSRMGL